MSLVLPLGLLYEAQKIINGEYHDLIIVKEEEGGPIDIIVEHAGINHHHDSEAQSGAHWWAKGDKPDVEFKLQITEADVMDLLDPEDMGEMGLNDILDTVFQAIYFDRMVDQLKIRKVDREAERLKLLKYKEAAMKVQTERQMKREAEAKKRHADFEKRKADKQREKDEARKYLLDRVKYARALLKAETMRVAAIKHAREIEERKRQAPHLNLPVGKLYVGEEIIAGVKGDMNISKSKDGHVHLEFKDKKTKKKLFELERTDDELITSLGYSIDKLKELDMKELLHLFSKLPKTFDSKTGEVKLNKLTEDEVKAAKKAVKEEILIESKPLLHDEIECGGKLYMVHLFDNNDIIRISAYEEIDGKDEGFHMEKSYTSEEINKLSQIDRAKFNSQFTYYNAILKSFKVILGKTKVLGKRQREITLAKYVPVKKTLNIGNNIKTEESNKLEKSENKNKTNPTSKRASIKAYNFDSRPKVVERKFIEKNKKIAGRDYLIKFCQEDGQIYLECIHKKSKKISKMKTSLTRLLQKLPLDKQFSNSDEELFENCLTLLKIKKGYGSSGGMILELVNYNEVQKKLKKRKTQRKRSASNVSSSKSLDIKIDGNVSPKITREKMSVMQREKIKLQNMKLKSRRNMKQHKKKVKNKKKVVNEYTDDIIQFEMNKKLRQQRYNRQNNNFIDNKEGPVTVPANNFVPGKVTNSPMSIENNFETLSIIPLHLLRSGILKMPKKASSVIGQKGEICETNASIVYDRDDVDIDRTCTTTIDDKLPTGKAFVSVLEKRLKTKQGNEFELALRVDKWGSPALKNKSKKPGYQAFIKTTPTLLARSTSLKHNNKLSPLENTNRQKLSNIFNGRRMSSLNLSNIKRSQLGFDRE